MSPRVLGVDDAYVNLLLRLLGALFIPTALLVWTGIWRHLASR